MKKISVILGITQPLIRAVLEHLLAKVDMEVVGHSSDPLSLLCSVQRLRPEVVFLWTSDPLKKFSGICSHLLEEYPKLTVVVLSPEHYTIWDVGLRTRQFSDLCLESLRATVVENFSESS